MFEIKYSDLAGRIGILHTNHGKIETPSFVPVIHPVRQSIPAKKIKEIGFDIVITNAYITLKRIEDKARKNGIHKIIKYDGSIMTDSGGYQVLEYGEVDVKPSTMAKFEMDIMTDFAIPLDKPTGFGLSKKQAKEYVDHTLKVCKTTIKNKKNNGQIWIGPIQGSEHPELVKRSTNELIKMGYEMLALGSPVEFMESYEYKLLAEMIIAAKKNIPASIPLHLFGAGHPLTIPLAVALGCDTFDSASYMLYAKHDRVITEDGTRKLEELEYFPFDCEVSSKFKPRELLGMKKEDRVDQIALFNLYSIKSEVDRVKQAIREGRLWEYTMKKARAHPKLFETIDAIVNNTKFLQDGTPKFKEKAIFLFGPEDQYRPELTRFREYVKKFRTKKNTLVITRDPNIKPVFSSYEYRKLRKKFKDPDSIQFCNYNPFLGIIPIEISDVFPASHYVMTRKEFESEKFPTFTKNWIEFFNKNKFDVVYLPRNDLFLQKFKKLIPKGTIKKQIIQ
ncbi:MAG: tRNA guanosine(15) transglycosylase TgtA [Thermoproteota archaeon]|nr:tRNA guanosine(15) transglycosylase TgtA [Thermoproteota archaeon]